MECLEDSLIIQPTTQPSCIISLGIHWPGSAMVRAFIFYLKWKIQMDENINIDDIIDGASRNVRRNMKKDDQPDKSVEPPKTKEPSKVKPGVRSFKTLEEAMEAMKNIKANGGVGLLVGIAEDQQEQYDLCSADEEKFYRLMEDLKKFCVDHNLPAVVQIQQGRLKDAIAISGFRNIAKSRTCGRMLLLNRVLDVLFDDNLSQEDYSILMNAVVRVMLHQCGGNQ